MILIVMGILFMLGYELQWYDTSISVDTIYTIGFLYILFGMLIVTVESVGEKIIKEIKNVKKD